jgi:thioredoxin-related protein
MMKEPVLVNLGRLKMIKALVACLALMLPVSATADPYLLMAEEQGCYWCAKWNEEIAHIYPKTAEGRTAPLQRYDLHSEAPDVAFDRRVHFTPTFILVENGREVGRIEGYPGEDFFWGLLAMMFERAGIDLKQTG